MAQLMQIRLQRYDAQPWGFRLQGGKDFAAPLVVQKINGGSLAEQAGLLPGDAVIKINDIDVYNLRHKEAQDLVVRSGNNFIVTVQRGGLTWRPSVTPTGQVPSPNQHSHQIPTVTKTSLAHKPQEVHHIGSGYNNSARPFNSVNGNDGQVKSIVNKQYNTPVGIYSDETIAETLSAQAEVLAGGVLGINFKKNEKQYQGDKSEVLKFLHEEETNEHQEPAPYNPQQIINNQQNHHIPNQYQSNSTRHVAAPIDRPKPPSTGGLPAGQNICTECERLIVGVFVRIKDKNLHVECFKCATCGSSLKNQGYYNFNNKLYCDIHARLAAMQNPPSGTDGYVPVPIKPNAKLSASTISAALSSIGYNGTPTNGNTTPSYSAPPSNTETTSIPDLPLPPPPSPTQLQQFQIQDSFCNNTALNNHSRTNSSLSTASSSSLSLSPYSSSNGINNSSCSPIGNSIENSLNNHNGYNNNNSSSPGHSRQQSTSSSTGSGNTTDFQLPPPPPPLPLPQQLQYNSVHQQQQNSMTINQSGKQNENDMNSNNRYAPSSMASSNSSNKPTNGINTNVFNKCLKEFANHINSNQKNNTEHSTPTSTTQASTDGIMLYYPQGVAGEGCESVNSANGKVVDDPTDSRIGQGNEQFKYVTLHGNVIRSVIPPGKGVSVNYKVNQGFARPYGAPAPAPAAAPKSPTSYPPPTQGGNWGQSRPVQQQQQPANNPYATLPRSNAAPQECEQHHYYEYESQRTEEHRAASYFEEDHEICEANRESRTSFNWPPPRDDSHDTPTAAPLYIAPPETQHVVAKPIQQKTVTEEEEEERLQQEQQQLQWQSRSAPQLTGLTGMNAPEIESSSDSYTSTCTTTTTTSEEYQRMYAAQVQAYQMQAYEQSGSELDYHMDMEVAAMQQQGDQCYLSSSEYISGRRSAQECVESLAGTLNTYRLVDMVREVTPSPVPAPKGPRHVEFVDEPQVEIIPKPEEPPKKEAPPKKEEPPKREAAPRKEEPPKQQEPVEESEIVKECYKVCGESKKEEQLVVEDRTEILESQRIFQPTPEIKIEIPPVKPIPPTKIPNPIPKEWISPMVRALTTAPDTPVHMVECPCPKPCDCSCQCDPEACKREEKRPEPAPAPAPEPQPEVKPEPEVLQPNTNTVNKPPVPMTSSTLPRVKPSVAKPNPSASQASDATNMLTDSISKVNIGNKNNFMAEAGKIISNMLEARLASNSNNSSNSDLTTIAGGGKGNNLTRSPMVVRKRFELEDFKNVDPTAPADLKPTQMVGLTEPKVQQPPQQKTGTPVVTGEVLTQQNHHMKNLIEICDAKRLLGPLVNGNKPVVSPIAKAPIAGVVQAPSPPPPQPLQQQKAQPQIAVVPAPPAPPTELAPLETVIFRNNNRSANKSGELSTHATDRRSYIERDGQSESAPVFEISVKPMGGNNKPENDAGIDETKAVVSQLLKDGKRPICCQCDKEISRGPFITALGRIWCPDHFMCVNANCRRPLQDIGFVEEKGDLYCEYCFEKYLAPTCHKCGGKIKGDCLNAIGRHFHPECFTCGHCGKLFGNTPFFLEEGMAYCEADWNELFTTKCFACGFPVEAGDRWVEALNHNYHSQCFNCTYCKKNLEGQSFYNKGGRPFCKNHAR